MSFHQEVTRTARKKYTCEWCLRSIQQHEKYIRCCGVFDGDFYDYCLHTACKDPMQEAYSLYSQDVFDYDCSIDYLRERAKDENPELLEVQK